MISWIQGGIFIKSRNILTFKSLCSDELVERLEDISNSESASGINQGTIDNRIEQAMDLVKSHLMNAVRSEVEELKEKIIKLEETISQQQVEMTKNREGKYKIFSFHDWARNFSFPGTENILSLW